MGKWFKHWTADLEVPGSGLTGNRDFLFRAHLTALTQKLRRRVTFVSSRGDIKPSVLRGPGYIYIYSTKPSVNHSGKPPPHLALPTVTP